MDVVKVMDINLSNKIAAGEVIETLMNVVKELVENSVDAESTSIKVELKESGIKQIRVIDNGKGMSKNDAVLSLERHATSKIYTDDDLFNINTLGFRGEAIPSIASVSHMTIKTCDGSEGTELYIEGGKIIKNESSDLRQGTEIIVEDIFYNTPARLKYLKSLYTEAANITSYINKMALSYPNIKFTLINDDKTILSTDGSGNLLKVINSIYGLDVTKKMIKISAENDDYSISGYISYPEVNRSSKNFITILVNGRSVRSLDINKAILEAYHTFLMVNRYPIVVLNIEADPSIIDVNIHPSKQEIKFSKVDELYDLVYNTMRNSLVKLTLIPEVKYDAKPISNINEVTTINKDIDYKVKEEIKPKFEDISFNFNISEEEVVYNKPEIKEEKYPNLRPLTVVHGTYIVAEADDGMYILDQHAANERVNYEYYLKELGKDTYEKIDLLVPMKLEFSNNEYLVLKQNFDVLKNIGFDFEEFGFNTIIIRSHPIWIKKGYEEESIRKIIEVITREQDFSKEKFNEKISITLACKMSIKANQHISMEEVKTLIERLSKTSNPFTCPHGRPTTISYKISDLEKLFKRSI